VGGVIGATYWDWLYINLMWIREDLRCQGCGRQLLEAAEAEGHQRGASQAYRIPSAFRLPSFYQKQGYQEFRRLENFPTGRTGHFLTKRL